MLLELHIVFSPSLSQYLLLVTSGSGNFLVAIRPRDVAALLQASCVPSLLDQQEAASLSIKRDKTMFFT
jgi:hypothetical protein